MPRIAPLPTRLLLAATALMLLATPAVSAERYELILADRSYVPAEMRIARDEDSFLVVQFFEIPTRAERDALAEAGITLLDYLPNYAWTAHVKGGSLRALESTNVRAVVEMRAEDKLARSAAGQDLVRAYVYEGAGHVESTLSEYGTIVGRDDSAFVLELTSGVLDLARENIVKYVAGPRPEKTTDNDEIRDNVNADEVQSAPYGLSGAGLTVGMWDNGSAATNHDDYNDRLTVGDGCSIGWHPAKVCGVMAGDGTRSTNYGGYPGQWAGVAPGVDIASYSWPDDADNMDAEHSHAISNYDIILSQNSWGWGLCASYCEYYGEYDDWSQNYDKLVRGSQGKKLTVVFSAGNDGNCDDCSYAIPDYPYGTIPGPGSTSKNAIVVGSNDADDDGLSSYSSRGPTLDGRLKPDVAAPGCKSYEGINTTYTSNNYNNSGCGTSYSAPVVSGCVALLEEDYIPLFGDEPWPSTVKALLIQGAEDQGNPGPDFQFGYGRVNIQNTVDIVRDDGGANDLIKEDTLSPSETWEYDIDVTGGELMVTLVWDDYEGDYGAGGVMLVNDLDLELECPTGTIFRPWVLNPSNPSANATTGTDHLNNVEQVEVSSPDTGTWTVRVTATVMPEANQDFSIVTSHGAAASDPPPATPTGLDAAPGSGEGEIDVSWNANSEPDLDYYMLERADNAGFTGSSSFNVSSTSYTDSGLTPGDTYFYRLSAVDDGGNTSGATGTEYAIATDLAPATPTGLVAVTGAGEGEIDVDWNDNSESDFDHYRLERDTDDGFGPGSDPFDTPASVFPDSGLIPGETYYYRVIAIDANGNESAPSASMFAAAQDLAPAAPTGLVAVSGTNEGEIDISWDANTESDLDHYRVERCDSPSFPSPVTYTVAGTSHTDSGFGPGDRYYYRVYAVDEGGNESSQSSVANAYATDLPPAAPATLVAIAGTNEGEIDISWDANTESDLDHYRLERDDDGFFGPGSDPFDTPATFFPDSGLIPGETYYYRVIAVDAGGNESNPSVTADADAQDLAPAAPLGVNCEPAASEGGVDVSWDVSPEADFDHYRLEQDEDAGFVGAQSFDVYTESYEVTGLTPGEVNFFRVFAVDVNDNESPASDYCSSPATDLPPDAVGNLVAEPGTDDGVIEVTWDASLALDLSHYKLERDTDPGFTSPTVITETMDFHTDMGLPVGMTYHYRVFAVDNDGNESDPSNTDSTMPFDAPPGSPTGLVAVSGPAEGEVSATWNANTEPDLDRYSLQRDTDPGFGSPFEVDVDTESYLDTGLTPGQLYYYRVFAIDAGAGVSAPSSADTAVALNLAPAAPTGLAAVPGAGDGEVDLSWDANTEADLDHYILERDTSDAFGASTVPEIVEGTSVTQTELPAGTYFYRLFAVDAGMLASVAGDTVSVTIEQTGVDDELFVAAVSLVRPNPFTSETSVHYSVPTGGSSVAIRLYDIRGRLVRTLEDGTRAGGEFDAAWDGRDDAGRSLPAGVYFCRAEIGDWSETRKMVLVR